MWHHILALSYRSTHPSKFTWMKMSGRLYHWPVEFSPLPRVVWPVTTEGGFPSLHIGESEYNVIIQQRKNPQPLLHTFKAQLTCTRNFLDISYSDRFLMVSYFWFHQVNQKLLRFQRYIVYKKESCMMKMTHAVVYDCLYTAGKISFTNVLRNLSE